MAGDKRLTKTAFCLTGAERGNRRSPGSQNKGDCEVGSNKGLRNNACMMVTKKANVSSSETGTEKTDGKTKKV